MSQDNHITQSDSDSDSEQKVTPFEVTSKAAIDYMKLINKFGCDPISGDLIERFEYVTNVRAHKWLRRGIFFSQKDLSKVLDDYEQGKTVYLYTGRGPSSEAMHMGHMIPFMFTKYLQDALDAILVIQMSDDEKYSFKGKSDGKSLEYYNELTYKNAKDIIACGFNLDKTFIFSNLKTVGGELYENAVKIMTVTGNQMRGIYGLTLDSSIGQLVWPSFQCAPAFSNSFPDILHPDGPYSEPFLDGSRKYLGSHMRCLVPMAIDQDPYFRMSRDHAEKFTKEGVIKPATIHTKFLVGLLGINGKMSSTGNETSATIYMTDNPIDIKKKIMKHAFSGGGDTLESHKKYGGNLEVDVPYQWLTYFLDDDEELSGIAHAYRDGTLLSGQIKTKAATVTCEMITQHQKAREEITDEVVRAFFDRNRRFDLSHSQRKPIQLLSKEVYATYGINFDLTFGTKPFLGKIDESNSDDNDNDNDNDGDHVGDHVDNNVSDDSNSQMDSLSQQITELTVNNSSTKVQESCIPVYTDTVTI